MTARTAFLLLFTTIAAPAAPRTWTDTKGRKIEAEFVSQTADKVTLKLASTGKDAVLAKTQLCPEDQEFLKTATAAPPAGRVTFTGQTYDSARLDKSKFKRVTPPRDLKITKTEFPHQMETEHFFIAAGAAVKPAALEANAEVCERLYAHMVRVLPLLEETFRDRRMAIWIPADGDEMMTFGSWINSEDGGHFEGRPTYNVSGAILPKAMVDEQKFLPTTRFLRGDHPDTPRTKKWGMRLFFVGGTALYNATRDVKMNDTNSLGLLELGWSYYLEGDICGNITTEVSFAGSGDTVEGFRNGRTWPAAIKAILKNGVKPSAAKLLQTKKDAAQPIDVGLAYGFCHWCFRDPARAKQFNEMGTAAIAASKAPDPETFVKAFGFADVAAFDKAFNDYLMSDRFQ